MKSKRRSLDLSDLFVLALVDGLNKQLKNDGMVAKLHYSDGADDHDEIKITAPTFSRLFYPRTGIQNDYYDDHVVTTLVVWDGKNEDRGSIMVGASSEWIALNDSTLKVPLAEPSDLAVMILHAICQNELIAYLFEFSGMAIISVVYTYVDLLHLAVAEQGGQIRPIKATGTGRGSNNVITYMINEHVMTITLCQTQLTIAVDDQQLYDSTERAFLDDRNRSTFKALLRRPDIHEVSTKLSKQLARQTLKLTGHKQRLASSHRGKKLI